jgi:putative endonuclease
LELGWKYKKALNLYSLKINNMNGYLYILLCDNGSYYTGSTIDLNKRLIQHQKGKGANHTRKHPPVALVYVEKFERISEAFFREKKIQGWSRAKKEALISGYTDMLPVLAECKNDSHFLNAAFDSAQAAKPKVSKPEPPKIKENEQAPE